MSEKMSIPISALIDVVFLLIMFFVATATIDEVGLQHNVDLALAGNMDTNTVSSPNRYPINLQEDGRLFIGPMETSLKKLHSDLSKHKRNFGNKTEVQIRADKHCPLSELEPILEVINKSGLHNIKIITKLENKHE